VLLSIVPLLTGRGLIRHVDADEAAAHGAPVPAPSRLQRPLGEPAPVLLAVDASAAAEAVTAEAARVALPAPVGTRTSPRTSRGAPPTPAPG
jgi:hypothetical protein